MSLKLGIVTMSSSKFQSHISVDTNIVNLINPSVCYELLTQNRMQ